MVHDDEDWAEKEIAGREDTWGWGTDDPVSSWKNHWPTGLVWLHRTHTVLQAPEPLFLEVMTSQLNFLSVCVLPSGPIPLTKKYAEPKGDPKSRLRVLLPVCLLLEIWLASRTFQAQGDEIHSSYRLKGFLQGWNTQFAKQQMYWIGSSL